MWLPIPERIDMETVCTKWKEACQLAWYDVKKYKCKSSIGRSYDNRLLTQSYLEKILLRCGNYLKKLSLSDVCDTSIMPFVSDHCKNLTTLECKFDDKSSIENADHFVQAFTQLDKLKCIEITLDYNYLDKIINLSAIINSLPEEINEIHLFSKTPQYEEQNISITFKKFKNLKKLSLHGLHLDNIILQEIAEITTLVYLDIGLYTHHIHENFSLFNKLINLEYIDLRMNMTEYIREKMFNFLTKFLIPSGPFDEAKIPLEKWINFRNLQHLGGSCDIMPDLANTIVKYCKNLKHLRIYDPDDIAINNTALKKLTELENLECLILHGRCGLMILDKSIMAISQNCKKLKRLEIPSCTIVPSIDGKPLSSPSVFDELSKLQCLEHLDLCYANNLKDTSITAIAKNCKNLKTLEIQGCRAVTETGFDALTNLKNLQKLNVSYLNTITNSFIIKLKGLKEWDCSYCQKLTNSGIIKFIKNNPDLEKICVQGIKNITIDMVIAADQVTKNRSNGIILRIRTFNTSILEASKSIIESQWLVVDRI